MRVVDVKVISLQINEKNRTATGSASVFSENKEDDLVINYVDDFDFYYELDNGFIACYLPSELEDDTEIIEVKLKKNLEKNLKNYLQIKKNVL